MPPFEPLQMGTEEGKTANGAGRVYNDMAPLGGVL